MQTQTANTARANAAKAAAVAAKAAKGKAPALAAPATTTPKVAPVANNQPITAPGQGYPKGYTIVLNPALNGANPKRANTAAYTKFAAFATGQTVAQYYAAAGNGGAGEIWWCLKHKFLCLVPPGQPAKWPVAAT